MKPFISPKAQGVLAYILGILLASSPWLFGFYKFGGAALFMPLCIGSMITIMSIFSTTGGFIKVFPIATNLTLTTFVGFIVMVSPFLWAFSNNVWIPHFALGLLVFGLGIFSTYSPFTTDEVHTFDARGR
ncbi:SPW repeat domain-containing protein [Mucilaginibacter sp. KACC 22063]|uniref:SPW repeat domain-containing protein n=1 Tax=Mucilaginibacter sp. KACC 22063 TaxID=3025666 RepID=UPI002366E8D7|nr:hypothetical protein [Mucilaginibacter sp. KACC 22063]WDF53777.1 hypothetical protein PQ461_12555 [Mucilaginibacter sp. KACC 22063]